MTTKWNKEDRAAWNDSEVMQELESKTLSNISKIEEFIKKSEIFSDRDVSNSEAVAQNVKEIGDSISQWSDADDSSGADAGDGDKDGPNSYLHVEEQLSNLIKFYNDLHGTSHTIYTLFDSSETIPYIDRQPDKAPINRVRMVVSLINSKLRAAMFEESSCLKWNYLSDNYADQERQKGLSFDPGPMPDNCHRTESGSARETVGNSIKEDYRLRGLSPPRWFRANKNLPTGLNEDQSLIWPQQSDADDLMEVVARLRGLLKNATDDGDIKLAYKIERVIEEILEEE